MLKSHLEKYFKNNKLYNSWLIQTHDLPKAVQELNDFIKENLLTDKIPLENHPDFKFIEKLKTGTGSKNINIDQIRSLQEFLSKTAGISNYKIAIIYQADLMNINAANSCLKILEDTPKNTYIFLLSSNSSIILPTIQSRCLKFEIYNQNQGVTLNLYEKYIELFCKNSLSKRLSFLKELAEKNKSSWLEFCESSIELLSKIIKKSANIRIELNATETKIYEQFKSTSVSYLMKKFELLNKLINNTQEYDLELKASFVLVVNLFES